ncbi:MAG: TldD/PmbA family protein [Deltaproteobacteria bacterium]|nr:TldD/PmbA family protein [Deltaproteobacteria bacterium]
MSAANEDQDRRASLFALGDRIVKKAISLGADVAEAVISEGSHLSAKVRLGQPELVEEAGSRSIGVRVMIQDGDQGYRVAVSYSSDTSEAGIQRLAEDAVELARLSEPDAFAGPPDPAFLSKESEHAELDLFDPKIDAIDGAAALRHATNGEAAALAADPRVTNSEGATFSRASGGKAIVTSGGFHGYSRGTYASLTVSPVVDDEGGKKRSGYHWTAKRHYAGLLPDEVVGKEAARRTLAKLGARKVETQECAIVFDPDAARSLLGLLAGSISGGAIWRKSSYLIDRLGTEVASSLITIVDDPLLPQGPGSRAFDGEGLLSRRNVIVENGKLLSYLLDTYSGKKLGLPSTASASRGGSGGVGPSTSNFVLQPGTTSAEEILASTPRGLYVTDMMGFGFNGVTGDFSRGASGFWIEDGKKTFPVSEVTISSNLDAMLKGIDRVGSDLDLRSSIASPTIRIAAMTLAGSG